MRLERVADVACRYSWESDGVLGDIEDDVALETMSFLFSCPTLLTSSSSEERVTSNALCKRLPLLNDLSSAFALLLPTTLLVVLCLTMVVVVVEVVVARLSEEVRR